MKGDACSVADSNCRHPAGFGTAMGCATNEDANCKTWCHDCGDLVCVRCSMKFQRNGKRVRVCAHCLERHEPGRFVKYVERSHV